MVPALILSVVAFIAGKPVQVACDTTPSPFPAPPGYAAVAWTYTGGDTIHALPSICDDAASPVGSVAFAQGIEAFLHEAARARGVVTDSCVEMTADVGVYDVLRRFYNIPFFSPLSESIGAQVLALTRSSLPASYQPEACWSSGVYH